MHGRRSPAGEVKDEMNAQRTLDARSCKAQLAAADEPPPLLHPEMADLYRQKVTDAGSGPGAPRNPHGSL